MSISFTVEHFNYITAKFEDCHTRIVDHHFPVISVHACTRRIQLCLLLVIIIIMIFNRIY